MFKRLFASLLAGMLALALLTGCGILNPSTPIQRVPVVERGLQAFLTAAQFSAKENKTFDAAIENTVNQISASPSQFGSLEETEKLNEKFNEAIQKADPNSYSDLFVLSGKLNPHQVVSELKQLLALNNIAPKSTFDARVYRAANPQDLSDNAWAVFLVRHAG